MTIDKKAEELVKQVRWLRSPIATEIIASALRQERQEAAERGLRAYDMLPTETVANYDYCRRALRDAIIKEA